MLFYGKTDVGKRRAVNQDNFIIRKYAPDALFAVVCDGMGGANGGNVASSLAAEAFASCIDGFEKNHPAFFGIGEEEMLDLLSEATTVANREVYRTAEVDPNLSGMGTTLVGCIIAGEKAYVVNVGDSRLYFITDEGISQITRDHSYVQYLIDNGKMTPEAAKHSNIKNVITQCVGTEKTVGPDFFSVKADGGCCAVLCSDGLTNFVEDDEILRVAAGIKTSEDIEASCTKLIDKANARGGLDNITAVILSL